MDDGMGGKDPYTLWASPGQVRRYLGTSMVR
jgi:hypothetical protein